MSFLPIFVTIFAAAAASMGSLLGETHTVRTGDTLWAIGQKYGVGVDLIRDANGIAGNIIEVGEELVVPGAEFDSAADVDVPIAGLVDTGVTEIPVDGDILRLQVLLDRAGFGPGKIDGMDGVFTRRAKELCERWAPAALLPDVPTVRDEALAAGLEIYIDATLPGSGKRPDFKALTSSGAAPLYASMGELLAERFHCSEGLLQRLNPGASLSSVGAGDVIRVPNVVAFEIERYLNAEGEGIWSGLVGRGAGHRVVCISVESRLLTIWEGGELLRSFPVTLNPAATPTGDRVISELVPGPMYARAKTGLRLDPGPNSPVGILWCPLGNGYGIHGTNDPDSIGRSVSSGCIRLANWDIVRVAGMLRRGCEVAIGGDEPTTVPSVLTAR